ncbi:redoxin domain-containing protein [Nocardiopsis tropica]|uniref:Redoxin domain-containing protein n=1 Tax=Nocardiopsis tropica TaxID=109330 RepID=A0ABU7KK58_9ACTN|nr:redoxin domain-containing protein [Nocardiopsis umidischolae]MEE2049671.1 redoxin domain-containing protein [Nocardiopsis umidischolae]
MTIHETEPPRSPSRRRLLRWGGLAALLALVGSMVVVLGVGFGRDPATVQSVLIDKPAPPLAGSTLAGDRIDIRDYRGEVLLVNVWASWCEACKREHPVLLSAQERLGPEGLQIIGINMSDDPENAREFLDEMGGATYPSVMDPDARIAVEWGTFAIPESYVIDRDGIIRMKVFGPVTPEWIDGNVTPMVRQ